MESRLLGINRLTERTGTKRAAFPPATERPKQKLQPFDKSARWCVNFRKRVKALQEYDAIQRHAGCGYHGFHVISSSAVEGDGLVSSSCLAYEHIACGQGMLIASLDEPVPFYLQLFICKAGYPAGTIIRNIFFLAYRMWLRFVLLHFQYAYCPVRSTELCPVSLYGATV